MEPGPLNLIVIVGEGARSIESNKNQSAWTIISKGIVESGPLNLIGIQ